MASFAHHATLVAATVAIVPITSADGTIEVINRTGTAEIYFTVAGPGAPPVDPVVGADDTFVVPAGIMSYVVSNAPASAVVKLLSAGTPAYSVIGNQR